jgi:hypothetical protein
MIRIIKTMLLAAVLMGTAHSAFADRGIGKKSKSRVNISLIGTSSIKNSLFSNLKSGLTYRGSILLKRQTITTNGTFNNSVVSFQKGNTIYILPTRNRIVMPEIKQGYTGLKIVIPAHK